MKTTTAAVVLGMVLVGCGSPDGVVGEQTRAEEPQGTATSNGEATPIPGEYAGTAQPSPANEPGYTMAVICMLEGHPVEEAIRFYAKETYSKVNSTTTYHLTLTPLAGWDVAKNAPIPESQIQVWPNQTKGASIHAVSAPVTTMPPPGVDASLPMFDFGSLVLEPEAVSFGGGAVVIEHLVLFGGAGIIAPDGVFGAPIMAYQLRVTGHQVEPTVLDYHAVASYCDVYQLNDGDHLPIVQR